MTADRQDIMEDALGLDRDDQGVSSLRDGQLASETTGSALAGVTHRAGLRPHVKSDEFPDDLDDDLNDDEEEDDEEEGEGMAAGVGLARFGGSPGSARSSARGAGLRIHSVLAEDEHKDHADDDSVDAALRADPASAGRTEQEKVMFRIQAQIRNITAGKQALRRQSRALRREQIGLKRAIATLEAERSAMGGKDAVAENDKTIRRGEEIMTKRIMKARADKMRAVGDNQQMRHAIDVKRREKVALLRACSRLEDDIRVMQERTKAQLVTISETDEETRAVENQVAGVIEAAKLELQSMEKQWEGLTKAATKASYGNGIPSPRDEDLEKQVDRELAAAERELLRGKPRQRGIFEGSHGPKGKGKGKGMMAKGAVAPKTAPAKDKDMAAWGGAEEDVAASAAKVMMMRIDARPAWAPRGTKPKPAPASAASKAKNSAPTGPAGRRLARASTAGTSEALKKAAAAAAGESRDGGGQRPASGASTKSAGAAEARSGLGAQGRATGGLLGRKAAGTSSTASKTLTRSRWKNAAMHARVGKARTRIDLLKAAHEDLRTIFGGSTPDETVSAVLARQQELGQLYTSIDKLAHEADELRSQIMLCRRRGREEAVKGRVEEAERRGMLASVGSSLAAIEAKQYHQHVEQQQLEATVTALHEGMVGVLESLDMGSLVRAAESEEAEGEADPSRPRSRGKARAGSAGSGGSEDGKAGPTPALLARLLARYFEAAQQRLGTVLADYSRLNNMSKARGAGAVMPRSGETLEVGAATAGSGGGGAAGVRPSTEGVAVGGIGRVVHGHRSSSGPGMPAAGVMSRAERRRSIDLSIADMRRHQLMQAIQEGGVAGAIGIGGLSAGGSGDGGDSGPTLPPSALQIGPNTAGALPTTLEEFARQAKRDVKAAMGGKRRSGSKGSARAGAGSGAPVVLAPLAGPMHASVASTSSHRTAEPQRLNPAAAKTVAMRNVPAALRGIEAARALKPAASRKLGVTIPRLGL